jgi:hypothetical protein
VYDEEGEMIAVEKECRLTYLVLIWNVSFGFGW